MSNDTLYFVATDAVNNGKLFRSNSEGWSEYNIGLQTWEPSQIIWEYLNPESVYAQGNFLQEIPEADVEAHIASRKDFWVKQWTTAKKLVRKYTKGWDSPIDGMSYKDYVKWQSDLMPDARARTLLILRDFSKLPDFEKILRTAGICDEMIHGVKLYHGDAAVLQQTSNYWILQAVQTELEVIINRPDLKDFEATSYRLGRLQCTYADYEKYPDVY